MDFLPLSIPEVILITPKVFRDERGFFMETYQHRRFAAAGIPADFVQDNHSHSLRGVLRGVHYQLRQAQGKLIRVTFGEVLDVAVDLRRSSPTFGQWVGARLSAENSQLLWIPPGFGHAFLTLSPEADVLYKATDFYAPEWERTLLWNDPQVGIDWPLGGLPPILSGKDLAGKLLSDAEVYD